VASHGTTANPSLCARCHVARFTVNDAITGAFTFQATGHLFRAIPCLGAGGVPDGSTTCAYTTTARSFQTCAGAGCHSSVATALSAFNGNRDGLRVLARIIWIDADGDQTLDAFPTDSGYLAKIQAALPGEFTADATITAAEGAQFNVRMVGEGYYANADDSKGVHNPFLAEALLAANINELQSKYPGTVPVLAPSLNARVEAALLRAKVRSF